MARQDQDDETTTVALSNQTADRLYELKGRKETYDDVVTNLVDLAEVIGRFQFEDGENQ